MNVLTDDFGRRARQRVVSGSRSTASAGIGLLDACDREDLFNVPLWPRQRQLLADIAAGPRMHVLALGRRASKTTMMAIVGAWCCLLRPELRLPLREGERGYAIGVATNLKQAQLMIRAARTIIEASPLLAGMIEGASESEIRFSNGTAFTAFPCTSRGGRGWPVFALLMDEVAHFLDTDGNSAAERVWQAFHPATAQFGDQARVVVSSTPLGSTGLFAELFERASDGQLPAASAHHATSVEINPTLSEEFLIEERTILGDDAFASEYLASFIAAGGSFLTRSDIDAAVVDRGELRPQDASRWVAGLDPAFSRDPFGLALVGQDAAKKMLVLGACRRWLPDGSSSGSFEDLRRVQDQRLDEVIEVCRRFNARVVTDQFCAPAVKDRLERAGLSVTVESMTAASKTDAFVELRARLASSELELYQEPQMLDELRRLRTRQAAGRAAVLNPRVGDSHGDMAQALALGVWGQRDWSVSARPLRTRVYRQQAPDLVRTMALRNGDASLLGVG